MNKPVKISSFSVSENRYCTKGGTYRVKDLIKLACKLKPFDLPLQGIDISVRPWGDVNMKSFLLSCSQNKRCRHDAPYYS